ncbi:MAG: carboxypeptidase regulatory-like domain-containing protein [Planctomycetes bacterium]|nr:carboxypeptidase regulatory-like domain-containing protein [Planctomycetota bacterium]
MGSLRLPVVLVGLALVVGVLGFVFFQSGGDAPPAVDVPEAKPHTPVAPVAEEAPVVETPVTERTAAVEATPANELDLDAEYVAGLSGLTGRIVELDGTPVAKIDVELLGVAMDEVFGDASRYFRTDESAFPLSRGSVKTGDDGRFRFERQDPDQFNGLGVDIGGPRATIRFVDCSFSAGQVVDIGDVVLQPFSTFVGKVVDDDGNPVAGARIRATNLPSIIFPFGVADLEPDGGVVMPHPRSRRSDDSGYLTIPFPSSAKLAFDRLPIPETKSADDGSFELAGVPPGLVSVLVNQRGLVTLVHGPVPSGAAGGKRDLGTLRMSIGETLVGRVVDGGGVGVAGCDVMVGREFAMGQRGGILRRFAPTTADGAFEIDGLADSPHFVCVRKPGDVDWVVTAGVQPGIDEPVMKLAPAYDLIVKAVDEQGTTLPRPEIVVTHDDDMLEAAFVLPPARVDAKLEHLDDGRVRIRSLGSEHYAVAVRADGFAVGTVDADVSAGPAEVTITLKPARRIDVTVLSSAKQTPIAQANVAVLPGRFNDTGFLALAATRTGKDGKASLRQAPPGEVMVRVTHPKYAAYIARLAETESSTTVALVEGGTLIGHVHEGGKPIDQPRMVVLTKNGRDDVAMPRFVTTDLEGKFTVKHLTPGEWEANVMPRFAHDQGVEAIVQRMFEMGRPERDVDVVITDGAETHVEIDLLGSFGEGPKGQFRGLVTMNGRPEAGASVAVRAVDDWGQQRTVKTDANGRFDVGAVPATDLVVTVSPTGSSSARGWDSGFHMRVIAIPAGGIVDETIRLETGAVGGRVTTESGQPLGGASVVLKSKGVDQLVYGNNFQVVDGQNVRVSNAGKSGHRVQASTDMLGEFTIDPAPIGEFELDVDTSGYLRTTTTGTIVAGSTVRVDVRLKQAVQISGRVVLPSGIPNERNVWLNFSPVEGSQGQAIGVYVDESMTFTSSDVGPGAYRVSMSCNVQDGEKWKWYEFQPIDVTIPETGLESMTVTGVLVKEHTYGEDG